MKMKALISFFVMILLLSSSAFAVTSYDIQLDSNRIIANAFAGDVSLNRGFQMLWNTSQIPTSATAVSKAELCLYINTAGTTDNDANVTRILDSSWTSAITTGTWNGQTEGLSYTNEVWSSTTVNTYACINATSILDADLGLGATSFRIIDPDNQLGTATLTSNGDSILQYGLNPSQKQFYGKTGFPSNPPYINLTYVIPYNASEGHNASATGETFNNFLNPTLGYFLDNAYATENRNGQEQDYFNYTINDIPPGAIISGIELYVAGKDPSFANQGFDVELSNDGGSTYTTTGYGSSYPTNTRETDILGMPDDLWGTTWTNDSFTDANFRVRLNKTGADFNNVQLDWVGVIVYFNGSGPDPPPSVNNATNVTSATITSKFGFNTTAEDITLEINLSETDGDSIINITDWRNFGTSFNLLNIPFEPDLENNTKDYSSYDHTTYIRDTGTFKSSDYGPSFWGNGYTFSDLVPDHVHIPYNADLYPSNLTISAWVNSTSTSASPQYIFTKNDIAGISDLALLVDSGNKITCGIGLTSTTFDGAVSTTTIGNTGAWYHVACTYDGSDFRVYINGVLEDTEPATRPADNGCDYQIGSMGFACNDGSNDGQRFSGQIDQFQYFNSVLSDQQLSTLATPNYWLLNSQELTGGDNITACATANDGTENGNTLCSNQINVLTQTAPVVSSVVLNSTSGFNPARPGDNLITQWISSDPDGNAITNITDWRLKGISWNYVNAPFEGGSNSTYTKDYSTYNTFMNVSGATFNPTGGHDGFGAYEFDGTNDYIFMNQTTGGASGIGNNWTISVWARDDIGPGGFRWIVGENVFAGPGTTFIFGKAGSNMYWVFENCGVFSVGGTDAFDGSYHHWVASNDNGRVTVYLDGVQIGGVTGTLGCVPGTTQGLRLGSRSDSFPSEKWNGAIDNFQLIDRPITQAQVLLLNSSNTYTLDSNTTIPGEKWTSQVIANDRIEDSAPLLSNLISTLLFFDGFESGTLATNSWNVTLNTPFNFTSTVNLVQGTDYLLNKPNGIISLLNNSFAGAYDVNYQYNDIGFSNSSTTRTIITVIVLMFIMGILAGLSKFIGGPKKNER